MVDHNTILLMPLCTTNLLHQSYFQFLAPVVFLSLFTLSAAVMGYLFCYQPLQLYIDGKKKQAVNLFLHTTLIFGCFTALALALLFTGIIK